MIDTLVEAAVAYLGEADDLTGSKAEARERIKSLWNEFQVKIKALGYRSYSRGSKEWDLDVKIRNLQKRWKFTPDQLKDIEGLSDWLDKDE